MEFLVDSKPAMRLALVIEYDGIQYHGFQVQAMVPTIQGEVEHALWRLTGERIRIIGASRTDAGVHATGQVVGFWTRSTLLPQTFVTGLNHYLPEDIIVREALSVDGLDIRRSALSREYRYTILNRPTPSPLLRQRAYFITRPLNVEDMNRASQFLVGRHDFASFAAPMNNKPRSTVRTVSKAEVQRHGALVIFDMVANSFLPQQVRRTVGALVNVGVGKISVGAFGEMVNSKKSGSAAPTAPPYGLCLMKVNYRDALFWGKDEDL